MNRAFRCVLDGTRFHAMQFAMKNRKAARKNPIVDSEITGPGNTFQSLSERRKILQKTWSAAFIISATLAVSLRIRGISGRQSQIIIPNAANPISPNIHCGSGYT